MVGLFKKFMKSVNSFGNVCLLSFKYDMILSNAFALVRIGRLTASQIWDNFISYFCRYSGIIIISRKDILGTLNG